MNSEQIHQRKESYTCGEQLVSAFLLLGGNLGDVQSIFDNALNLLHTDNIKVIKQSSLYQSEPWGFSTNDVFYNQAVEVETRLSAPELLQTVLAIESELGRTRSNKNEYESRLIDIDILLYEEESISSQRLTVPHPLLHERNFALIPLEEIAPNKIHPIFNKTITTLSKESKDKLKVWRT